MGVESQLVAGISLPPSAASHRLWHPIAAMMRSATRRLPVGAEPTKDGVHFRVWAPRRRRVEVVLEGGDRHALTAEEGGYFSGVIAAARVGSRYKLRLDDELELPDPASRAQPEGPHGPSLVVDPSSYRWRDEAWRGPPLEGQVIYELHVGTYTREGTFRALMGELDELARLGVTTLELLPIAEFSGRFGWGYDGVDLFAPTHLYGSPDDVRAFVDAAHARNIAVILDVVYNHLGPDGNYLAQFSDTYFTRKYSNEWGEAVNFDDAGSAPVRELFIANAGYWIDEFHFDGLRLDATQCLFDDSKEHVVAAIGKRVREAARGRRTLLVAENEPQHAEVVRPIDRGGWQLDMIWNDDFHHSAVVAVTGRCEAYYRDTRGRAQELLSAVKWGFLYQGQRYAWQKKRRGTPALDVEPKRFVTYLQNHDQIANSARGDRLHALTSPGRYRAITALLLLAPATPMLFQGQEFAASSPFLYFADHGEELAELVAKGRREFIAQFPSTDQYAQSHGLDLPNDPRTFEKSKLDTNERKTHAEIYEMHKELLRMRREMPVFREQKRVDGAVLSEECFLLRYFDERGDDRLLVINLGPTLRYDPAPEPLLAPPLDMRWTIEWSSEDTRWGGLGTGEIDVEDRGFELPAHAAVVLRPAPRPSPAGQAT